MPIWISYIIIWLAGFSVGMVVMSLRDDKKFDDLSRQLQAIKDENWLDRQLDMAQTEVKSWPAWKRDRMRQLSARSGNENNR